MLSFFTIISSTSVYGIAYDCYGIEIDEKTYFYEYACSDFFYKDIRSKALNLMDRVDKNKNKSKATCLLVLLEIELDNLKLKLEKRMEETQNSLKLVKEEFKNQSNNLDQYQIKNYLNNIETEEDKIRAFEEALYLTRQWKKDYCR